MGHERSKIGPGQVGPLLSIKNSEFWLRILFLLLTLFSFSSCSLLFPMRCNLPWISHVLKSLLSCSPSISLYLCSHPLWSTPLPKTSMFSLIFVAPSPFSTLHRRSLCLFPLGFSLPNPLFSLLTSILSLNHDLFISLELIHPH